MINRIIFLTNNITSSNYHNVIASKTSLENASGRALTTEDNNSTTETSELEYLINARYVTIFFCIFSFYLFAAAAVHGFRKKDQYKQYRTQINDFLIIGAAFAAFFSCSWQVSELWSCCVISCRYFRWIYALCYMINSSFIYTVIWLHQRKLYSDPRLSESKSKCIKASNTGVLVTIQVILVLVIIALVRSYKLEQTEYGCALYWSQSSLYASTIPITIVSAGASAIFRIALLVLIVYPLFKRITGISFHTAKIIKHKQINQDIKEMIIRLALCTFLSLFAKVLIDVIALLEAINLINIFVSNIRVLELIVYSFLINFTYVNWKQRLFPFIRYT